MRLLKFYHPLSRAFMASINFYVHRPITTLVRCSGFRWPIALVCNITIYYSAIRRLPAGKGYYRGHKCIKRVHANITQWQRGQAFAKIVLMPKFSGRAQLLCPGGKACELALTTQTHKLSSQLYAFPVLFSGSHASRADSWKFRPYISIERNLAGKAQSCSWPEGIRVQKKTLFAIRVCRKSGAPCTRGGWEDFCRLFVSKSYSTSIPVLCFSHYVLDYNNIITNNQDQANITFWHTFGNFLKN